MWFWFSALYGHFFKYLFISSNYSTYSKYLVILACVNNVDTDQTPRSAASDLSLHCLPLIQQFYTFISGKMDMLKREVNGKEKGVRIFGVN